MLQNFWSDPYPYHRPDQKAGPFQPSAGPDIASFDRYSDPQAKLLRNSYYNALRYVDDQIGKLVEYLEMTGRRRNTIIAITGDHGEAFKENSFGYGTHAGYPLEAVLRTGLVLNCPDYIST